MNTQSAVCATCGNHCRGERPDVCVICADERQWIPPSGQRWTSIAELIAAGHRSDVRAVEPGLTGIGAKPSFGIGQRSLVIQTPSGNLLWDPSGFIDDDAVAAVRDIGGLRYVTASHPHFYGAITEWSAVTGATILIPDADATWFEALSPAPDLPVQHGSGTAAVLPVQHGSGTAAVLPVQHWSGTAAVLPVQHWSGTAAVLPGVTLIQCGGHFPGSAVVHWAGGADGRGVLLAGDTIFVTPGEDRVTFVWSAPNRLPLPEPAVTGVWNAVRDYDFDRIYGGWWTPVLRSGAKQTVASSAQRYIQLLQSTPTHQDS